MAFPDGKLRRIPFLDHLGVELVAFGQGRAELAISVRPELCNSLQVAHGGVVMTVLDAALAIAGRAAHTDDYDAPLNTITIEMKTSFLRPGAGRLLVRAECVHRATSLMFCEGEARDVQGLLVARASGTFKLWTQRPGGAPKPHEACPRRGPPGPPPRPPRIPRRPPMTQTYRRIVLAGRPEGAVRPEHFRLETVPVPEVPDGHLLVRNRFLSLDPYMRGAMNDRKSYRKPQEIGATMVGGTVGEVVASRHPRFALGDVVVGGFGWQEYGLSDGAGLRKVDASRVPMQAFLGVAGMPGVTAWVGLNRIIAAKAGETVVVSAASGAVGSVVGQLAKAAGCRVVGVAGGSAKCAAVVGEFGFDACVDHKGGRLEADLAAATPDGIDGYFDNVGGPVLDAVLARMNAFGRIAVCGLISGYNDEPIPVNNFRSVLTNRLKIQGFIVSEVPDAWPPALAELAGRVADGTLRYRETVSRGLESAPAAFIGLLRGENFGKQLVELV